MQVARSGTPFDLDAFLEQPMMAHLATSSPEGPRESPLWFLWEDECVWFIGTSSDSFPNRISLDQRCAIGFVQFELERGALKHIGMRGSATVEALNESRLHRLLRRYLGHDETAWNPEFRKNVIAGIDLMVRFVPASVVMRDQSYFQ
jgi:Pyridoxamine 5'-phosphate oxidase